MKETHALLVRVERLEAIEAIHAHVARYCELVDAMEDAVAVSELFTENAQMQAGSAFEGRGAIADFYRDFFATGLGTCRHNVINPVIDIGANGDQARMSSRFIVIMGWQNRSFLGWGDYNDEFVRTGDQWLYDHKETLVSAMAELPEGWGSEVGVARPWFDE